MNELIFELTKLLLQLSHLRTICLDQSHAILRGRRIKKGFESGKSVLSGLFGISKVVGKVDGAFGIGGVLKTEACFCEKRVNFVDRFGTG